MKIVALNMTKSDVKYELAEFSKIDGCEFLVSDASDKQSIISDAKDADVILFSSAKIDAEIIDSLANIKLFVRYGIGYDNIDHAHCAKKGIFVCNAPNYGVVDVAEHAMALILACSKRIPFMHHWAKNGRWYEPSIGASARLQHKTIGFLGFGKIARCVCERTNAFGMKPIVYDPYVNNDVLKQYGAKACEFESLLKESDYLTLHLPLSDKTFHIIGKKELELMKPTAVIINTGRGGLVNQTELIDALQNGVISGAGLDVFEDETAKLDERLFDMRNVALTPHVAWNTLEATDALHMEVTNNVVSFLNGNRPESIVNGL
ncbi:MAG: C-terminal binding protein [Ruminococcaceae bacterium]|nr:C-terminal binding protein [Oscillospiraceae bacterium]